MSTPPFAPDDEAATPLTPDESRQLIPSYIATRAELNAAEQRNILVADQWAFARRRDALDLEFLVELHRRMFRSVWKWAGRIRDSERNIGVAPARIRTELRLLVDDARYWVAHHTYPADEIAARFHHRLVLIHAFPNGNGRHARLATDVLLLSLGQPRFTWGGDSLVEPAATRTAYIAALRAADAHDLAPLLRFVRS